MNIIKKLNSLFLCTSLLLLLSSNTQCGVCSSENMRNSDEEKKKQNREQEELERNRKHDRFLMQQIAARERWSAIQNHKRSFSNSNT